MAEEDKKLKIKGVRSKDKPFQFNLHIMPDVGHDSNAAAANAVGLLFPVEKKAKGQLLYFDFTKGRMDRSGNRNKISSRSRPIFERGKAIFSARNANYIQVDLNQASRIVGCTEMTIRGKIRMEPNSRQHRAARIIQTSDNQYFGSAIVVVDASRIGGWIQTTSSRATSPAADKKPTTGRSPTLVSTINIDDGQWHDVALIYTGSQVKLLIDGLSQGQADWSGAIIGGDEIDIGYVESNGFYFDGEISEIEILGHSI